MITADQILCSLVGDYILQNDWMARNKVKSSFVCAVHVVMYTLPFLLLTTSWRALAVISVTHFIIDRWRLARFVGWIKNGWWLPLTPTGYQDHVPPFMAVWLMIITDNILHIAINGAALTYLG
jgi:Protein of unknown function (DUF3307)